MCNTFQLVHCKFRLENVHAQVNKVSTVLSLPLPMDYPMFSPNCAQGKDYHNGFVHICTWPYRNTIGLEHFIHCFNKATLGQNKHGLAVPHSPISREFSQT